jgi:uncharacterized protein YkwD
MARFTALVALLATAAFASATPTDVSHTVERRSSQEWLSAHNTVRARHGARALTWGTDLEAAAKNWAQRCVWQHSGGAVGPYGGILVFNNIEQFLIKKHRKPCGGNGILPCLKCSEKLG